MDIAIENIKQDPDVNIKIEELVNDIKIEPQELVQLVEDIKKENVEKAENLEDPLKIGPVIPALTLCIKDEYYKIGYDNCMIPNIDSFSEITGRKLPIHNDVAVTATEKKNNKRPSEIKNKSASTRNNSCLVVKESTLKSTLKDPITKKKCPIKKQNKTNNKSPIKKRDVGNKLQDNSKEHPVAKSNTGTNKHKSPTKTTKSTVKKQAKLLNDSVQEHTAEIKEHKKSESTLKIGTNLVIKENIVPKVKKKKIRRRIHQCSECSYAFTTRQLLTRHVRVHTGERPFPCHLCPYKARLKGSLVVHLKVHSGERDFICTVCYKLFASNRNLQMHSRIHSDEKPFQCYHCESGFRTKQSILQHIRNKHSNKALSNFPKIGSCICHVCGKAVPSTTGLTRHMAKHSTAKPYLCDVCGNGFKTIYALKHHTESLHTPTSEKSFKCEYCDYITSRKATLLKHAKSHIRHSDLVECQECGKRYTTRLLLKHHILEVHESENKKTNLDIFKLL